jgi:hypothetical protein
MPRVMRGGGWPSPRSTRIVRAVPNFLEPWLTRCGEGVADARTLSRLNRGLYLLLTAMLRANTGYKMISKIAHLWRHQVLAALFLVIGGWYLRDIPTARLLEAQTLVGIHGDRTRIMLGFRVKSEAVQARLPTPWQLHPVHNGPLRDTNFIVALVDRVRDDDPEGKPKFRGTDRFINFVAPAKHPQTGQIASIILGGWASNSARVPGFFQVYRAASFRVEQVIKSQDGDAEEVTDAWEVQDTAGLGGMELRLQSRRLMAARTRARGEAHAISAKDQTLWQLHKFDAVAEVVKSVPAGINKVQGYSFRLSAPEYGALFDGSEQLISIRVTPWYVRQVFVR